MAKLNAEEEFRFIDLVSSGDLTQIGADTRLVTDS
jgi:hypothetical protein